MPLYFSMVVVGPRGINQRKQRAAKLKCMCFCESNLWDVNVEF